MNKEIKESSRRQRERYHSDPEYRKKMLEKNRIWHEKNKDYWKKNYKRNPEAQKLAVAKWYANNAEKLKQNYLKLKQQREKENDI